MAWALVTPHTTSKPMTAYSRTMSENLYCKPAFTELDDCFQQGEAAGDQAYPRDRNPYESGTTQRQWWDAGWSNSLDELCGENREASPDVFQP